MTTGEMHGFTKLFNEIMQTNPPNCVDRVNESVRASRLENMMTDLEQAYEIPVLQDAQFNKQHPHLMQLYITVSEARTF